uniref:Uncharacterized protein n=1 Tax=Timema bartmani TaxID=61472 RepID=A0A7R9FC25_9NEOP|nr:unnamed protein product [Timema bartmani]
MEPTPLRGNTHMCAGYDYSIVAGTNLWYENSSRRAIEYFVPHPNFTANIYGIPVNDLGLYKVNKSGTTLE